MLKIKLVTSIHKWRCSKEKVRAHQTRSHGRLWANFPPIENWLKAAVAQKIKAHVCIANKSSQRRIQGLKRCDEPRREEKKMAQKQNKKSSRTALWTTSRMRIVRLLVGVPFFFHPPQWVYLYNSYAKSLHDSTKNEKVEIIIHFRALWSAKDVRRSQFNTILCMLSI